MGRPRKHPKQFRPTQLVEPKEPCCIEVDGIPYNFNPGRSRPRGDHPAVMSNPGLFKPLDPETEAEKHV
jgi:hypothetical protein